jgi:hypothetical protein
MSKKLLWDNLDIIRWDAIFVILSMDLIDPYVEEMGLKINHDQIGVVKEIARSFFEQYYQLEDRCAELSAEECYEEQETLIEKTFSQISQMIDEKTEKRIYLWGIEYFQWGGPDGAEESPWMLLLRGLAGLWAGDPLPPPEKINEEKIDAIIQAVNEDLGDWMILCEEFDNLEKKSKTDWEKRVYRTYVPDTSPLDAVMLTIDFYRFQRVWRRIESILSKKEMEALLQWGMSYAHEFHREPESVSLPTLKAPLEDYPN